MERLRLGQPRTVGGLRRILSLYGDTIPLAVRNGPLATFYELDVDRQACVEIEIPTIRKGATDGTPAG